MKLDEQLLDGREAYARQLFAAGELEADELAAIVDDLAGARADPVGAAIDELVADEVLRRAAATQPQAPTVDVNDVLASYVRQDVSVRVRIVTLAAPLAETPPARSDWPAPPASRDPAVLRDALTTALAQARSELAAGTPPAETAARAQAAGWRATGRDRWLPAHGPVGNLPAMFLAAARDATTRAGDAIGPVVDDVAAVGAVGSVLALPVGADTPDRQRFDETALSPWAAARAAEEALRRTLLASWRKDPGPQVRVEELAVGSADLEGVPGRYVSFSHLVVGQLPPAEKRAGETYDNAAARIGRQLREAPVEARSDRFAELVAAANGTAPQDPLRRSGELGFFTSDQLLPALAAAAFAPGVRRGDVIGPLTTAAGPELFLVRAQFAGTLDERTSAALVEARSAPDLLALAQRVSPAGEAGRATGDLWRSMAEFEGLPEAQRAYGETQIRQLSDPFVLDGEIVVVRPQERKTALLGADVKARLESRGFERWLAAQIATADVRRDPEPLPGSSTTPSLSLPPPSTLGQQTPYLPSVFDPVGRSSAPEPPLPTPRLIP